MAAALDRPRHNRTTQSLRYHILQASTLEQLCGVLSFTDSETLVMLSLGVGLDAWRRLSHTQAERILNGPELSNTAIGAKMRFYDALFAEKILLAQCARAHAVGHGDLPEQKLAKHMTARYRRQASDLDVTSRLCFASTLPDVRYGAANGFFPHRICEFLGLTKQTGVGITLGNRCIQIGNFRIGCLGNTDTVIGQHLCIGHKDGKTIQIFRGDGTLHPGHGVRTDWNPWSKELGERAGITFGNRCIQIGNFRIGFLGNTDTVIDQHLCIGHKDGKTIQIFRGDGTLHPGNGHRTDWNPWSKDMLLC